MISVVRLLELTLFCLCIYQYCSLERSVHILTSNLGIDWGRHPHKRVRPTHASRRSLGKWVCKHMYKDGFRLDLPVFLHPLCSFYWPRNMLAPPSVLDPMTINTVLTRGKLGGSCGACAKKDRLGTSECLAAAGDFQK